MDQAQLDQIDRMRANAFTVSPLAVRQKINRHFQHITSPRMQLIYDYNERVYVIMCEDGRSFGPIVLADLLPLARYFGVYRPADRRKPYQLLLPDGSRQPEGKLRNSLHIKFVSAALKDLQVQLAKGGTVQQSTDASNVAGPVPEQDLSKLYTSDLDDAQRRQLAQKEEAMRLFSASEVEYPEPPEGFDEPAPLTS